jgi:hypothetical protein
VWWTLQPLGVVHTHDSDSDDGHDDEHRHEVDFVAVDNDIAERNHRGLSLCLEDKNQDDDGKHDDQQTAANENSFTLLQIAHVRHARGLFVLDDHQDGGHTPDFQDIFLSCF